MGTCAPANTNSFGMFGTAAVIIFSGIPSIWLLVRRGDLRTSSNIKSQGLIAADLISAYLGVSY